MHIVQRGNNRSDIFRADDDRHVFLWALKNACLRFRLQVHAYVLMTNHIHLIATPDSDMTLAHAMQFIGRYYVPYFNRRYGRTGGLFEGRYRAHHIQSERYWYNAARYVELNPVRSGLVVHPAGHRWSSYRAHAFGDDDAIVSPHYCYDRLGSSLAERQQAWRVACDVPLSEDELWDLRNPPPRVPSIV